MSEIDHKDRIHFEETPTGNSCFIRMAFTTTGEQYGTPNFTSDIMSRVHHLIDTYEHDNSKEWTIEPVFSEYSFSDIDFQAAKPVRDIRKEVERLHGDIGDSLTAGYLLQIEISSTFDNIDLVQLQRLLSHFIEKHLAVLHDVADDEGEIKTYSTRLEIHNKVMKGTMKDKLGSIWEDDVQEMADLLGIDLDHQYKK